MTIINLVLSAHGYGDIHNSKPLDITDNMSEEHTFVIPDNFYIMSYSDIDTQDCLMISNNMIRELCNSSVTINQENLEQIKVLPHYKDKAHLFLPKEEYPNIALWSDEGKTFDSNVISCETNEIIYDIDILPDKYILPIGIKYKLTLHELIYNILNDYPDYIFCLHLLVCTNHVPELSQIISMMSSLKMNSDKKKYKTKKSRGISKN